MKKLAAFALHVDVLAFNSDGLQPALMNFPFRNARRIHNENEENNFDQPEHRIRRGKELLEEPYSEKPERRSAATEDHIIQPAPTLQCAICCPAVISWT